MYGGTQRIHRRWQPLFPNMRHLVLCIFVTISITVHGQELTRVDLMKIMESAIDQGMLPSELIINREAKPFMVIRSENDVEEEYSIYEPKKITFWTDEQIFLIDATAWMIPISTNKSRKKANIKYRTDVSGLRKNPNPVCHEGQIKARFKNSGWEIISSDFKVTECSYSNWKLRE